MGIFYILTVIAMITTFVLVKKSEKKVNLISWCILALISYLGFNILVCMVFGVFNIRTDLLFLSIVNLILTSGFSFKIYKDKKIQQFEIRKRDFIAIAVAIIIVCYMAVSQYTPLSKTMANASVDACMHYSASTNFADNMKILAKIDNQTGYNFKTMQTGAYINTGIFMSVVRSIIPDFKDFVTFKIFEIGIMLLNILAMYMLVSDKLKTKTNYVIGIVFVILYAFAYPYTSLLYGFSYLSVAIAFATGLFYLAKIYDKNEANFVTMLSLIFLMGVRNNILILFICFSIICIYMHICVYKRFCKKGRKNIFKIFQKRNFNYNRITFSFNNISYMLFSNSNFYR